MSKQAGPKVSHNKQEFQSQRTRFFFKFLEDEAQKYSLKVSTFLRMVATKEELKVKEFETDKILLEYGNNFIRIKNLLRNSEWSAFENKKNILLEIETVLTLIKQYLYQKIHERENLMNEEL